MTNILKFCNENHQYIIAGAIILAIGFWVFGCDAQVHSIMQPEKMINRAELQLELDYLIGQAKVKFLALDKQDEIKQTLLDAANVISSTGQINPSGLLNIAATIVAISFGLNRNQALQNANKKTNQV